MRNTPLIEGRPLLVRVHVTSGQGFTARQLRGVATIGNKSFEEAKMISGNSDPARVASTFNVLIPSAEVKPGAGLSVAVYETGAGAGADASPVPRFPAEGTADLAIKAGRMVLDIVAVPVTGPGGALANNEMRRQKLENDIYDVYPVQKVNLRIREPVMVANDHHRAWGCFRSAARCPHRRRRQRPSLGVLPPAGRARGHHLHLCRHRRGRRAATTTTRARAGCRSRWCAGARSTATPTPSPTSSATTTACPT